MCLSKGYCQSQARISPTRILKTRSPYRWYRRPRSRKDGVRIRTDTDDDALIPDIREECEFSAYHIKHSMLVPRGILETACEYEYEDAGPELFEAGDREIILNSTVKQDNAACQSLQRISTLRSARSNAASVSAAASSRLAIAHSSASSKISS